MNKETWSEVLTRRATMLASGTAGACFALAVLIACLASWPFLGWERAIGWADPVATLGSFLLLFLLQRSQAKDTLSLHVKLDELLCAVREADDDLVSIEERPEEEIRQMHDERRNEGDKP